MKSCSQFSWWLYLKFSYFQFNNNNCDTGEKLHEKSKVMPPVFWPQRDNTKQNKRCFLLPYIESKFRTEPVENKMFYVQVIKKKEKKIHQITVAFGRLQSADRRHTHTHTHILWICR